MENKDINPVNNEKKDDKTIVYSTDKKVFSNNSNEKTTVSNPAEKTQTENTPGREIADSGVDTNKNVSEADKTAELKDQNKSKGFSTGSFAAGVVGAGIAGAAAGVAGGTVFSDDIKEVFAVENTDPPQSTGSEIQEGSTETIESFEISATDSAGNTYIVSFLDIDSDGSTDLQTDSIQFVDGSSISYTQIGESLNPLFMDQVELASPQEYQGLPEFTNLGLTEEIIGPENSTHSYIIKPGDTLSEIAAANNTSIEHLMELNPGITDPDLIYANNELVIPDNDNISNPYEIDAEIDDQTGPFSNSTHVFLPDMTDQPVSEGFIAVVDLTSQSEEPAEEVYFESVDWASFSEEPVTNDGSDYGNALSQTDFESYNTPDSYVDNSYNECGNDFVSSEFL
jgi:LysM repeat protein